MSGRANLWKEAERSTILERGVYKPKRYCKTCIGFWRIGRCRVCFHLGDVWLTLEPGAIADWC